MHARIAYLGPAYRLSFWRTVDGAKVDLVVETPREVIPIDVKYTRNPRPADARGVEHFLERHRDLGRAGFVVCRVDRPEQLTPRVRAIPWDSL